MRPVRKKNDVCIIYEIPIPYILIGYSVIYLFVYCTYCIVVFIVFICLFYYLCTNIKYICKHTKGKKGGKLKTSHGAGLKIKSSMIPRFDPP